MTLHRETPVMGAGMRAVRRELAGASDEQVLQVLRFVDGLQDRSQADGLLAPLRGRLRVLRPPRPIRFDRLLFMPLEPVIVDPAVWRLGAPALPRNAMAAIAAHIRASLPFIAAEVDRIAEDSSTASHGMVGAAGRILWSDAAAVLRAGATPADWAESGLPASIYPNLARACAALLGAAWKLHLLTDPGVSITELNSALTGLLSAAEPEGALTWGMLLTITLQRFPQSEAPLHAAAAKRANRDMRQAGEAALEAAWRWIEDSVTEPAQETLHTVNDTLHRQIGLLLELGRDATHRRRALALQAELRAACATRFGTALDTLLGAPMRGPAFPPAELTPILANLEDDARALRRLDFECRRLGNTPTQDAQLNAIGTHIANRADIPPIDRARLIEILLGTPAALRLTQTA